MFTSTIDEDGEYGVWFDEEFDGGHDLSGRCPQGYGHWVAVEDIELVAPCIPVDAAALDALLLGV